MVAVAHCGVLTLLYPAMKFWSAQAHDQLGLLGQMFWIALVKQAPW